MRKTVSLVALMALFAGCASAPSSDDPDLLVTPRGGVDPDWINLQFPNPGTNYIKLITAHHNGPYTGNYVELLIEGQSAASWAPKCKLAVDFARSGNAIHPNPENYHLSYVLPTIPTTLETIGLNNGGTWKAHVHPAENCVGADYDFTFDVLFTSAELEPVITSIEMGPDSLGNPNGHINIYGKGDLSSCQLSLEVMGPFVEAGVQTVSMNGALSAHVPIHMAPWVTVGLSYSTSASIQPIGGCTLLNPNMENKKTTTANFIKVY